jgi:hypothetical protein
MFLHKTDDCDYPHCGEECIEVGACSLLVALGASPQGAGPDEFDGPTLEGEERDS